MQGGVGVLLFGLPSSAVLNTWKPINHPTNNWGSFSLTRKINDCVFHPQMGKICLVFNHLPEFGQLFMFPMAEVGIWRPAVYSEWSPCPAVAPCWLSWHFLQPFPAKPPGALALPPVGAHGHLRHFTPSLICLPFLLMSFHLLMKLLRRSLVRDFSASFRDVGCLWKTPTLIPHF